MRSVAFARTRRVLAAGVLFLSVAVLGACDGSSPVQPGGAWTSPRLSVGDTAGVPGDTVVVPGDTVGVPGDTVGVPGDTVVVPGDTVVVPGDTLRGPRRGRLAVSVLAEADSGGVAGLVAGVVVSVSRGGSEQEGVRVTTTTRGPSAFSVRPGLYVVRLESIPEGYQLAPGESAEARVVVPPGGSIDVRFLLVRQAP